MTAPGATVRRPPATLVWVLLLAGLQVPGFAQGRAKPPANESEPSLPAWATKPAVDLDARAAERTPKARAGDEARGRKRAQIGLASFYGGPGETSGNHTTSGERVTRHGLTAAHRSYPFGTRLKVTNLTNGRWVIVRVNDRGPHKSDRIIDLSYAAAKTLRFVAQGIVRVRIEPLESVTIASTGNTGPSLTETARGPSVQLVSLAKHAEARAGGLKNAALVRPPGLPAATK